MKNLFRRPGSDRPKTVPIDPAGGDPVAAGLIAALEAADWPTARSVLTSVDPEFLSLYTGYAMDVQGAEQWLPDIVRRDLDDPLPLLVYGARAIGWAWDARTSARAKNVSREQFEVFWERLRIAEDCLQGVVRRSPDNTAAWYHLLITARGLELGIDEARSRFDRAVARYPYHTGLHNVFLQQLLPKWGGSWELAHGFADRAVANGPPGTSLGSLIAAVHIEHWLDLPAGEDDKYIGSGPVRESLRAAADRSIRHPGYRPRPGWPGAHNTFAAAFCLSGDLPAAAEQFRLLGDLATEFPWCYLRGGAGAAYCTWRKVAVRAG
jgi:hypothetical protein